MLVRKIYLIGLQEDNVRQQISLNSCAKWRKDELHNRKEPFSPLVFIVQSQMTEKHGFELKYFRIFKSDEKKLGIE
jgi:hypothetical protein